MAQLDSAPCSMKSYFLADFFLSWPSADTRSKSKAMPMTRKIKTEFMARKNIDCKATQKDVWDLIRVNRATVPVKAIVPE